MSCPEGSSATAPDDLSSLSLTALFDQYAKIVNLMLEGLTPEKCLGVAILCPEYKSRLDQLETEIRHKILCAHITELGAQQEYSEPRFVSIPR